MTTAGDAVWWQRGVIYQIYPRSFQDSNGDGIGDLEGIRRRLPYLRWLGVDAIWISPFYPSPMADFGYDVADYCNIDRIFGSLADFDHLMADAHIAGLKVILDFVPNHTSDRHPWFEESRHSIDNPKRNWYIWRDPKPDGGPPNNWYSHFGGPAWTFDPNTGQYYCHLFLREQPDLNWRNADVRAAMHGVLRFWLDRGVDGFRVDVMSHLIKDEALRDNPPNPAWREGRPDIERLLQIHSGDRPEVHDVVAELRALTEEYDDRVLIGEIYLPIERLMAYYGRDLRGAHLPFNFHLLLAQWDARNIERLIAEYDAAVPPGGWPNWVLGNHDQHRIASRIGAAQTRVAALLLLTLRGTPTLYYGDELGMPDGTIPPEAVHDPWEKNEPGRGFGRDPERTPMQWTADPGAGFSEGRPWLPLAEGWQTRNVASEMDAPRSLLRLYRALIALRRETPALSIGSFRLVPAEGNLLAYDRAAADDTLRIVLNLGAEPADAPTAPGGTVIFSSSGARTDEHVGASTALAGGEGLIVRLGG
ncbi:MAG: DUF3459 domain-containing protein [Bauldia sp.]|nr:DUF3459 domain-containing protein [Bauldia sp.]